jgi:hypothetical protein
MFDGWRMVMNTAVYVSEGRVLYGWKNGRYVHSYRIGGSHCNLATSLTVHALRIGMAKGYIMML